MDEKEFKRAKITLQKHDWEVQVHGRVKPAKSKRLPSIVSYYATSFLIDFRLVCRRWPYRTQPVPIWASSLSVRTATRPQSAPATNGIKLKWSGRIRKIITKVTRRTRSSRGRISLWPFAANPIIFKFRCQSADVW